MEFADIKKLEDFGQEPENYALLCSQLPKAWLKCVSID